MPASADLSVAMVRQRLVDQGPALAECGIDVVTIPRDWIVNALVGNGGDTDAATLALFAAANASCRALPEYQDAAQEIFRITKEIADDPPAKHLPEVREALEELGYTLLNSFVPPSFLRDLANQMRLYRAQALAAPCCASCGRGDTCEGEA